MCNGASGNQYNANKAAYTRSNVMNDTSSDDEDEDDEDDEDDEEDDYSDTKDDDNDGNGNNAITLDNLISSMGVKNIWSTSVPARFLSVEFAAAQGKLFTVKQAKALCELYKV